MCVSALLDGRENSVTKVSACPVPVYIVLMLTNCVYYVKYRGRASMLFDQCIQVCYVHLFQLVLPVAMVSIASSLATVMEGPSVTLSQALASVLLVTVVMGVGKVHCFFFSQYIHCTCACHKYNA